jgi:hypothetical protein
MLSAFQQNTNDAVYFDGHPEFCSKPSSGQNSNHGSQAFQSWVILNRRAFVYLAYTPCANTTPVARMPWSILRIRADGRKTQQDAKEGFTPFRQIGVLRSMTVSVLPVLILGIYLCYRRLKEESSGGFRSSFDFDSWETLRLARNLVRLWESNHVWDNS